MWVKICGIRDVATAEQVAHLSPDAIGLNFYAKSVRFVPRNDAIRIAGVTGDRIKRIGVFVNQSPTEIEDAARECRLNGIQLHGDESASDVAAIARRLPDLPIFLAWRMEGDLLNDLGEHLDQCLALGVRPEGCLIDSRVPGAYGGTGHAAPWEPLAREYRRDAWPPLILAGGLNAGNVDEAIRTVRPWGVDVASGVESLPGVKNLDQVRRFIETARMANAG